MDFFDRRALKGSPTLWYIFTIFIPENKHDLHNSTKMKVLTNVRILIQGD